jgi:hypothetical protein
VTTAVLTPFTGARAVELGNSMWRKRVLPVGDVEYKGRMLHFTKDYLAGLVQSFRDRAYDQVPFQLAGSDNSHTNDVERFGGAVTDFELGDDGLYIKLAATERGAQVLKENPNLGVSARIVEDYARSDGKFFSAAVQHVLGTLDPRIPGLGGWQAVEASNDVNMVLDLSTSVFTGQETAVTDTFTTEERGRLAKLLQIPEDKIDALAAIAGSENLLTGEGAGSTELTDEELAQLVGNMSDEDLAALEQEFQLEVAAAAPGLSNEAAMAIEMANVRADETDRQLSVVISELDTQRYEAERARLVRDSGVPPFIVEMARPLLEGTGKTVDLSNGKSVDAGQVMRKVLTEFAKAAKMMDMSVELGSAMDEPIDRQSEAAQARDDVVGRARAQMFGM